MLLNLRLLVVSIVTLVISFPQCGPAAGRHGLSITLWSILSKSLSLMKSQALAGAPGDHSRPPFSRMPPWFFLSILPSRKNLQGATSDLLIIIFWMPVTSWFCHFKTGNQNTTMSSKQNCQQASVHSSLVCRNSTCFHGAGQSRSAQELFSLYNLSNWSFSELVSMWYKHHWLCKTTCRINYL